MVKILLNLKVKTQLKLALKTFDIHKNYDVININLPLKLKRSL